MSETTPDAARADEKPSEGGSWASETKEFLKAVLWAVLIAVFLRSFVVEAYKIPSGSMLPTLEIGDHIFVNKFLYGFMVPFTTKKFFMWRTPKRGEVIVFKYPPDVSKDYIKRVIGEPGDVVEVKGDELYVNGELQPAEPDGEVAVVNDGCRTDTVRQYVEKLDSGVEHMKIHKAFGGALGGTFKVPDGELFVMGDNRDNSQDSRTGFTVPYENVKGRAMFVWLSWNSCGEWWPLTKIRFDRIGEGVR